VEALYGKSVSLKSEIPYLKNGWIALQMQSNSSRQLLAIIIDENMDS
jgi:hypothetical protein